MLVGEKVNTHTHTHTHREREREREREAKEKGGMKYAENGKFGIG
jgi:hypothetical protein